MHESSKCKNKENEQTRPKLPTSGTHSLSIFFHLIQAVSLWSFHCSLAPPPKRVSMRRVRRDKINFWRFFFLSSFEGGLRERRLLQSFFFPSKIMHTGNNLTYTRILNAHPHLIAYPPSELLNWDFTWFINRQLLNCLVLEIQLSIHTHTHTHIYIHIYYTYIYTIYMHIFFFTNYFYHF